MTMSKTRQSLLAAYYGSTLPVRWWARRKARVTRQCPVIVLFYHRVAEDTPNDWTMPRRMFERQVAWLRRHVDLVSLEEAQRRIRSGRNERTAVSITFDDGYADNCRHALPLLVRNAIPCTYFVSVDHVVNQVPFPHDLAAGKPLAPNTPEQLRLLANSGVEIGLHTRTHADVGRIDDPAILKDEVVDCGTELGTMIGRPIRYFAFPYGLPANLGAAAFRLGRDAGYLGMCSAFGAYNLPGADPFHVRRVHADPEWIRWLNWVTLDPRKLHASKGGEIPETEWRDAVPPARDARRARAAVAARDQEPATWSDGR